MALSKEQIQIITNNPLDLDDIRDTLPDCTDALTQDVMSNLLAALTGSSAAFNLPAPHGSGNIARNLFFIRHDLRAGSLELEKLKPLLAVVVDVDSPDTDIWAAAIHLIEDIKPTIRRMPLSKEQIQIIMNNPLDLDEIRDKLLDCADAPTKDVVANLLFTLAESPAAFNLGDGIGIKLFTIRQTFQRGSLEPGKLKPLLDVINSSDTDIWAAAIHLTKDVKLPTPPPNPTFRCTRVKMSSSRLEGDSETRDIAEHELFCEIKKCTFCEVKGFWDKFLNPKCWAKEQTAMLEGVMSAHNGTTWMGTSAPDEQPACGWIRSLEDRFLAGAPHKLHTTKEREGQMDLFFRARSESNSALTYKEVLVVGNQKETHDTSQFKETLLQLARHVRGVFTDQPTRRFVHAFSLCGSTMELWVFDRSGPYSSGTFDIHEEPGKFARALVGYATISNDEMGLDTFIEREDAAGRYATLDCTGGKETKVQLVNAMVRQRAIVSRATTCYETKGGDVAKFSWVSDKRKLEVEQLRLAEERGVKGVAKVVAHRQITTIAELREGLVFPNAHQFRDEVARFTRFQCASSGEGGWGTTFGRKRKRSHNNMSGGKRQRPDSNSNPAQELNGQLPMGKDKASEELWENRIYSCLVVSPAGRVISDFRSVQELLETMRDAIKAHQSLYTTGNILHRDISPNNIIITRPTTADGFKGMLIDLDMAKMRDSGPSDQTGTLQFMAIEVLRSKGDHTYRHDLESFFYVLLWLCARQSWWNGFGGQERPTQESCLRKWEGGILKWTGIDKTGQMTINGLNRIMDEFPTALVPLEPLCLRIRSILFGDTARLAIGTPTGDPDQLYGPILAAYDEAIEQVA
ncbi:hypothetical protein QQX98_007036 [Neonectria punicea]|uniref:EKC/KEOPS complex subunit BUD32 n=1 Tax=Neonectria punicea TaxID=979145 RepID=A0ABR1GZG8_9HYPO